MFVTVPVIVPANAREPAASIASAETRKQKKVFEFKTEPFHKQEIGGLTRRRGRLFPNA
jgi:hypothetical protein